MPDFLIKGDITDFLLICILVSIILKMMFSPNMGAHELGYFFSFMMLLGIVVVISYLLYAFLVLAENFILPYL
jgi:hypothetical protein